MPHLKVVALISGGKDSFFSILHCQRNGHETVALANLSPKEPQTTQDLKVENEGSENEDIDSYMYQTVGASVIPLYAEALGLPLYQRKITGQALSLSTTYEISPAIPKEDGGSIPNSSAATPEPGFDHDEVESMTLLLKQVLIHHPEINAICSGAILSNYQRTRVESVALRLGLTPLAYLWQHPYLPPHQNASLLYDMHTAGQESRIIKVASGSLDASHLWLNVADPASIKRLVRDVSRFGNDVGDVLGEGGEYETLCVNGPSPLWKKRIEVEAKDQNVIAGQGGTSSLHVGPGARLVPKPQPISSGEPVRIPSMFDSDFDHILEETRTESEGTTTTAIAPEPAERNTDQATVIDQLNRQLERIIEQARQQECRVAFIMMLMRNMSDFAFINKAYDQWFQAPNPPARVTISIGKGLGDGVDIVLHATLCPINPTTHGLHVQSRSYWAPANIGPYSQAISVQCERSIASVVHIAGQIPLVPASMELLSEKDVQQADQLFFMQAILSLQHLWRVGRAMKVSWWPNGVAFITAASTEQASERARAAMRLWERTNARPAANEDDEDSADDAEIARFSDRALQRNPWRQVLAGTIGSKSTLTPLHDPQWTSKNGASVPCLVVQVHELPRQAPIEWYSTGVAKGKQAIRREQIPGEQPLHLDVTEIMETACTFSMKAVSSAEELIRVVEYLALRGDDKESGIIEVFTAHRREVEPHFAPSELHVRWIDCCAIWAVQAIQVYAGVRYTYHPHFRSSP